MHAMLIVDDSADEFIAECAVGWWDLVGRGGPLAASPGRVYSCPHPLRGTTKHSRIKSCSCRNITESNIYLYKYLSSLSLLPGCDGLS